jgi:hypothetical protein
MAIAKRRFTGALCERKMFAMHRAYLRATLLAVPLTLCRAALAAEPPAVDAPPAAPAVGVDTNAPAVAETPPTPKPSAPAYSLPWQLRPAAAVTVVRFDTSTGVRSIGGNGGATTVTLLLASYKVTPDLAVVVRDGFVDDSPPLKDSTNVFSNPALGATYVVKLGSGFRLAPFLGVTLPIGSGGGNTPDPAARAALAAGALTRSSMDNALFAVNYMTPFPGIDLAWVGQGFTVQAEATVFELLRTRGDAVDKDAARTNFTTGLHVGYFVIPALSVGGEIRYQRWLKNPGIPDADARRDTATAAIGVRAHFKLSDTMWLRPGAAYVQPLDAPMTDQSYHVAQLDLPLSF